MHLLPHCKLVLLKLLLNFLSSALEDGATPCMQDLHTKCFSRIFIFRYIFANTYGIACSISHEKGLNSQAAVRRWRRRSHSLHARLAHQVLHSLIHPLHLVEDELSQKSRVKRLYKFIYVYPYLHHDP